MGRSRTFSEAQITRAMKAARSVDPTAVIEVTREGIIRILPAGSKPESDADRWFRENGND